MWEWCLKELQKAVKALPLNKCLCIERDDVVSNVLFQLCQEPYKAKKIYEEKNIGILYQMAKHEIYFQESKMLFSTKTELSRYQRIIAFCKKNNIEPLPENAYKISELLENGTGDFSIARIIKVLSVKNPINKDFNYREKPLEI